MIVSYEVWETDRNYRTRFIGSYRTLGGAIKAAKRCVWGSRIKQITRYAD